MPEIFKRRGWVFLVAALPLLVLPILLAVDVELSAASERLIGLAGIAGALASMWLTRRSTSPERTFNLVAMAGVLLVAASLVFGVAGRMILWAGFGIMCAGFIGALIAGSRHGASKELIP